MGGRDLALTRTVPAEDLVTVRRVLRDHSRLQYRLLSGRTAVDWVAAATVGGRFQVSYRLLSTRWNHRLTVNVRVGERRPVPSLVALHPCADWYEREVYDRFGVPFAGHPDLRRLLTDYGFQGHPLRKDFPLSGFTEVRYDEAAKRVVQEPLSLSQARRRYAAARPWQESTARPLRDR